MITYQEQKIFPKGRKLKREVTNGQFKFNFSLLNVTPVT